MTRRGANGPETLGWSGRWIARVLRLYPTRFRREYGEEMLTAFLDQRDDAVRAASSPATAVVRTTLRSTWYLARAALMEWVAASRRARPPGAGLTVRGHLETAVADFRYAGRTLRRQPGFTVTAIVTLALGIGATSTIFSVLNGVLLKPLPFDEPDRLVGVWHRVNRGSGRYPLSPGTYLTYRDENRVFEDLGLWRMTDVTVTGLGEPERVAAMQVTDGTFGVLRVDAALGRRFNPVDDTPGTPLTVMLGHGYWRRRFGADSSVIGRNLTLNGVSLEVIGVLPRGVRFLGRDPAVFFTFRLDPARVGTGNFSFRGVARLRPGVTVELANADVARMLPLAPERFASGPRADEMEDAGFGPDVHPLKSDQIGNVGTVIWVLFGTVGLVLLIACVNVTNLFLVRAETRQRETAVRAALGAGRRRLAGQFLTESLLLGVGGGLAGLGLAAAGLRLLVALAPNTLPRLDEIAIDPMVLAFTLVVAVGAGLGLGGLPLRRFASPDLVTRLQAGTRGAGDGRARHRLRNVLAVTEVALALLLLIGSGLMVRSFRALLDVSPGFSRPDEVLTFRLSVPSAEVPDPAAAAATHERLLFGLRNLPGVASAGAASSVPLDGFTSNNGVEMQDFPTPDGELSPLRRLKWVSGDYFATMGIPLVAGRAITWDDVRRHAPVAVISENLAREYWSDPASALGRRLRDGGSETWGEIVGVAVDVREDGIDAEPPTLVYWPFLMEEFWGTTPFVWRSLSYAVRVDHADPVLLLPQVRASVWSINGDLPVANPQAMQDLVDRSMARTSFTLVMLGIAAAVALALGVVGIYGVISFVVAQRTREIGVRMALGARQSDVRRLLLRYGGTIALAGVAVGFLAAAGLTRYLTGLLYGVRALDGMTFTVAGAIVAAVAVLASYLPARRAAGVDPVEALRWE